MSTENYTGGCHCGAVRYHVTADIEKAMACNCSICSKTATLLVFVPAVQFTLESGDEALTDYQFNKMHIHHAFCKHCGIRSFCHGAGPDGTKTIAINVRCLDDVDLEKVLVDNYDGKSL